MTKLCKRITLFSILIVFLLTTVCYGATGTEYVKVRIRYPRVSNEQAALKGYGSISVYEINEYPEELFNLNSNQVNVQLDSYKYYHIELSDYYNSYEKALSYAEEFEDIFGDEFYPYYDGESFRVYAGFYSSRNDAGSLLNQLNKNGYDAEAVNMGYKGIVVYNEKNKPVLMFDNSTNLHFTSYYDKESIDMIMIDNRPYRGYMGFKIIEERLVSINFVDLESYLYGVVPNEISASWGMESLKAQAVAARTYAIYNKSPRALYDMDDNQNSQVYRGYNSEKESTDKAVDETRGEMIYYDDKLIQAFYHSTSGGSTESTENVWFENLPYAVGVDDGYSDRSGSPYNEWQKSYSKEEIIKKLRDDGNDVRELYSVEITKVTENNRVVECIFSTDIGEILYKKENARLLLGLMSSWFDIVNGNVYYFTNEFTYLNENRTIPSRGGGSSGILDNIVDAEEVEEEIEDFKSLSSGGIIGKTVISDSGTSKITKDTLSVISSKGISTLKTDSSSYNFEGRGWGHGIGMSQYGAKQMAEEGFSYDEILKHYFTGVTIR
ncbi:SpoIID/LytB domain-containing protein [Sedimentibacter hydroxybenzoicus DSM 7310]|uniref:SpoIID/LytB domain-containing protein n=1 Tax=Sedimentibacter hydroxybenzoicus DSM 7310 TaxID=1123245 RepID=A0A974BM03_SEDHY|nr:SpoIID/LytB domain-containing protein [Sedimentibacter hydroxybenzoicus]NYB75633.1 SpoIID/LytB domain-containing protein [Sedimentibacter hydroxybenzoicus DSM 7310]